MRASDSSVLRLVAAAGFLTLALGTIQPAAARPEFLVRFQADKLRRAGVDGCGTCHVKTEGGGARNDFGAAFDAANREITPLLRANFPQHFDVPTATLADGSTFYLSDPTSQSVVLERNKQKVIVEMSAMTATKAAALPAAANRMTFFVTSTSAGEGGRLGGLAGADRHCQALAKAAGAGDLQWHAYLSTSFQGRPAANAGDRIGGGPWFNAKGVLVARGPIDLHTRERLRPELVLTELGQDAATAAVLTGTLPNGTAAVGQDCNNWTATEGEAVVGEPAGLWQSARTQSCASPGDRPGPRLYCFARK